jgi:hypothetical protein
VLLGSGLSDFSAKRVQNVRSDAASIIVSITTAARILFQLAADSNAFFEPTDQTNMLLSTLTEYTHLRSKFAPESENFVGSKPLRFSYIKGSPKWGYYAA